MKWFNARLAGTMICGAFLVNSATVQAADMITFDPDGSARSTRWKSPRSISGRPTPFQRGPMTLGFRRR